MNQRPAGPTHTALADGAAGRCVGWKEEMQREPSSCPGVQAEAEGCRRRNKQLVQQGRGRDGAFEVRRDMDMCLEDGAGQRSFRTFEGRQQRLSTVTRQVALRYRLPMFVLPCPDYAIRRAGQERTRRGELGSGGWADGPLVGAGQAGDR